MWFLKFVTLSCILYALTRNSDAVSCGKGQMLYGGTCVPCPNGFYQPEKTTSQSCEACRKCHESKGSSILRNCTSEENTICKCKSNFVAQEDDSSTCKCRPEFTQQSNECVKKKKKNQISTTATIHDLTTVASLWTQGGATTQEPTITNITTTTDHKGLPVTTKERTSDSQFSRIGVGLVFVIVAILILTALISKHIILSRLKRRPEQPRDNSFRIPVEESGDGSHDSLKQNQEEP